MDFRLIVSNVCENIIRVSLNFKISRLSYNKLIKINFCFRFEKSKLKNDENSIILTLQDKAPLPEIQEYQTQYICGV